MPKNRTQKYIDNFCEYIDRLISIWKSDCPDSDTVFRTAIKISYRADFMASVLNITGDGLAFIRLFDWGNLEYQRQREKQELKDSKTQSRVDILEEWKERALKIKLPIKSIESYNYNNKNIAEQKINNLSDSLRYMQSAIESGVHPKDIKMYGELANNSVIEMGLVSFYRKIAIDNCLIPNDRVMPYNPYDWEGIIWRPSDKLKVKIKGWLKRVNSLKKDSDAGILPENRSRPISLSEMAGYLNITTRKLANLIKSGHYKHKKLNRQTYIFDTSQIPANIKSKISA